MSISNASTSNANNSNSHVSRPVTVGFLLGTLGVVFGDIGTSPLYAVREVFHHLTPSESNVLGALSLFFWALLILISGKYLSLVMRADNKGEGGALALMALAQPNFKSPLFHLRKHIGLLGVFGAAMLYGDSILTPSISVLSAMEGLKVATPVFEPFVIPATLLILLVLFYIQSAGTAKMGAIFGPITLVWFLTLGALGIKGILLYPSVLTAVNPIHAISFFLENKIEAFFALGAVFLCLTGGESLYADMGHFGKRSIRLCWFFVACPCLLLNYMGQGALLITNPSAISNPFYLLAPEALLYPLVALASLATISASQAVISGAFSITSQAIKLGLLPRMPISHTSTKEVGQIYVGRINWILCVATMWLVIQFKSSSNLAAAYGIAVASTMLITTLLMYVVMRNLWGWNRLVSLALTGTLLIIDGTFFAANLVKFFDGGWFPLTLGVIVFYLMLTWQTGRKKIRQQMIEKLPPLDIFIKDIPEMTPLRVPGTAIYMSSFKDSTPPALLYNLKHNRVIHDVIVIMTVIVEEVPFVSPIKRVEVKDFGRDIFQVIIKYGFKDNLDLARAFKICQSHGLDVELSKAIFFLGRERGSAGDKKGFEGIRQKVFGLMLQSSQDASTYFGINPEQIIELGFQVEV